MRIRFLLLNLLSHLMKCVQGFPQPIPGGLSFLQLGSPRSDQVSDIGNGFLDEIAHLLIPIARNGYIIKRQFCLGLVRVVGLWRFRVGMLLGSRWEALSSALLLIFNLIDGRKNFLD